MDDLEGSKPLTHWSCMHESETQKMGIIGEKEDTNCEYEEVQTITHLLVYNNCPTKCVIEDLESAK